VPATLASDAHDPQHVARDFEAATSALQRAGYKQFVTFAGRQRTAVALPGA
jgi:hypothetical protein